MASQDDVPVRSNVLPQMRTIREREPERDVIQMAWGRGLIVIYDAKYGRLLVRRVTRGKLGDAQLVGTDITVDGPSRIEIDPRIEIDDHQARQTA